MAGAALLGVQHGLERFNASFPDPFYSNDIGTYLLPVFILGAAASFLPTAIAMSRSTERWTYCRPIGCSPVAAICARAAGDVP